MDDGLKVSCRSLLELKRSYEIEVEEGGKGLVKDWANSLGKVMGKAKIKTTLYKA